MYRWLHLTLTCTALAILPAARGLAQPAAPGPGPGPAQPVVPEFLDTRNRPEKPSLPAQRVIRFLTDEDYPPFHFAGPDGVLTGFNVELARAVCGELKISCTVQSRRWDTLVESLERNQGDAVIASLAITPAMREKVAFTVPYYRTPARFVARSDRPLKGVSPGDLAGVTVGVVAGSAHEAFLRRFFVDAVARPFPDADAARAALRRGDIEAVFGDGVGLAVWLASSEGTCCRFERGAFLESRYFGDGVGIAVRRDDDTLRRALDYALYRLWETGTYADLYLKYFPVGFF